MRFDHDHPSFEQDYILRKFAREPENDLRTLKDCLCPSCFLKAQGYTSLHPVEDFVHHIQMTYTVVMLIARSLHTQISDADPEEITVKAAMDRMNSLADLMEAAYTLESVANMIWEDDGSRHFLPDAGDLISYVEGLLFPEEKADE